MCEYNYSSPEISIIIPTYNRMDILFYCLKSLMIQTFPRDNFEILVIDDASSEDIKGLVENFQMKSLMIRYFRQEKKGQACALNLGIRNAKGRIILLLDNDMICQKQLVEEHFKFHQKYTNHIIRGAYANTEDYITPQAFSESRFHSTAFFIAGNVSIKKDILIKAGMFDEDFKEYGWLDLELGMRLKKLGLSAVTNEKAFSYHYQKRFNINDFPALCNKEIQRGHTAVLFFQKHPNFRVKMATMNPLLLFLGNLINCIDWSEKGSGKNLINFLYFKNCRWLVKQLINIIFIGFYSYGVKEELEKLKKIN